MRLSNPIKLAVIAIAASVALAFVTLLFKPVETRDCSWSKKLASCAWTPSDTPPSAAVEALIHGG